ncbi:MAG: Asp23/Gls24 family envelope stress response protein [Solobacterium sp.]|nr:Asp23/Gls24 family envelope stress response protein [Solobacterium sp.]
MAQDYVMLNEEKDDSMIAINKSVFKAITEISIDDIENAVRLPDTRFAKPLSVKVENNKLLISADIKIKYGANVNATCELVQNRIYENVLLMTGFKASDITVNVIGFEI